MSEKAIVILKEQLEDIKMDMAKIRGTLQTLETCRDKFERVIFELENEPD